MGDTNPILVFLQSFLHVRDFLSYMQSSSTTSTSSSGVFSGMRFCRSTTCFRSAMFSSVCTNTGGTKRV